MMTRLPGRARIEKIMYSETKIASPMRSHRALSGRGWCRKAMRFDGERRVDMLLHVKNEFRAIEKRDDMLQDIYIYVKVGDRNHQNYTASARIASIKHSWPHSHHRYTFWPIHYLDSQTRNLTNLTTRFPIDTLDEQFTSLIYVQKNLITGNTKMSRCESSGGTTQSLST